MKKDFILVLFAILLFYSNLSFGQLSGNYIIGGPNGNYPNPSIAIQSLIQQGVNGPVTFEVYPGLYQVKVSIPVIQGSSEQNTVTFISQTHNPDDVEFYYSDNILYGSSYIILLNGAKNIAFKYISFIQKGVESGCILVNNYSGNIKLIGNKLSAPNFNPNHLSNALIGSPNISVAPLSGYFYIEGNIFHKGSYGIRLSSSTWYEKATVINNTFKQCYRGVILHKADSVQIMHNYIYSLKECGVFNMNYLEFSNNTIYGNFGTGSVQEADIKNNTFISNQYNSLEITNTNNCRFYYNSVLSHFTHYLDESSVDIHDNTNMIIKNNIFVNDSSGYLVHYNSNSNILMDYNVYYTANDTIFINLVGPSYTSLSSWQSASGQDAHSVFVKPNFSKLSDLHLQPNNSQIVGAGVPLPSVVNDIDGDLRNATHPDIGADEYVLRPILDTVVWACAGSSVILDAGAGFSSYKWSNGASTQTITIDTSGVGVGQVVYSVVVSNAGNSANASTRVIWQNCTSLLHYQEQFIDVNVFPNPTNGIIIIDMPNDIIDFELRLYNSSGKLVIQRKNQYQLNVSECAEGLYFIHVLIKGSSIMRKLIIR